MPAFSKNDIPEDWRRLLRNYLESNEWIHLEKNIQSVLEQDFDSVRPEPQNFFKSLQLTPVSSVKVVIVGQDPYHSPRLAQGLAFSIPAEIPPNSREFPSSLRNISKALAIEGFGPLGDGDLHHWAEQGVLLLNTALSVKLGKAGSHAHLGWKGLVDQIIICLSKEKPGLTWMLWGAHAQSKLDLIKTGKEQNILLSSHPSGLGVYKTDKPFLEKTGGSCKHFSKANDWLTSRGLKPIQWVKAPTARGNALKQPDLFK
ncbi:uracil-DNA glycosylase [Polynucleobacter necessarius]|uniref:uracil-DNA glycosylase n=1 Tax=Polynucleobacter necessarius TaxID=576610 RepID=UPI000E093863|nr:uracil-DNA glycosylase [Polynucleobacter necessarius]